MARAHPATVVPKGDVKHPMQTVLDTPMSPYDMQILVGLGSPAANIGVNFAVGLLAYLATTLDLNQALRALPLGEDIVVLPCQPRKIYLSGRTHCDTTMVFVEGTRLVRDDLPETMGLGIVKNKLAISWARCA